MSHFSPNQLKFIDWLAQGKHTRMPHTEELFAEQIGVNRRTLYRWKQGQNGFTRDEFWEAVTARARELLTEALSDVYESLKAEALKGSYQHTRLILEMAGEYTEKKIVEGGDNPLLIIDGRD